MEQVRRVFAMLDRAGRRRVAVLAMLILFNTVLEVSTVGLVLPFIAVVGDPSLIQSRHLLGAIYAHAGMRSTTDFLIAFGAALFALILFKNLYAYWVIGLQGRLGFSQVGRISAGLLERYLAAPYEVHLKRNSSESLANIGDFTELVFSWQVLFAIVAIATEAAAALGIVALLLVIEPQLTLVLVLVLGACLLILTWITRLRASLHGRTSANMRTIRIKAVQEALSGFKEIKVLGREAAFLGIFRRYTDTFVKANTQSYLLGQLSRPVLEVVVFGGIVLVIVLALMQDRGNGSLFGVLGLFAAAAFRILPGINRLTFNYHQFKSSTAMVDALAKDWFDPRMPSHLPADLPDRMRFTDSIDVRGVSFAFAGSDAPVLSDISLSIRRGEAIGLVGPSGAGKSTLVDVLLGLLVPQSGAVTVDGHDITGDPRPWRRLIGYVPQSIALIDDSLRNNIAFGIDPAGIDDRRIGAVLRMAQLEAFAATLPEGLNTRLGEDGVRLSGGQRQRIGVARALYHDPEVLILDEATSSLDNESERAMTAAIEALRGEKTMLIIAHRLSTVKRCDRLVFLKDGRIADIGGFDELVARCGDFREMVRLGALGEHASGDRMSTETTGGQEEVSTRFGVG